MVLFIAKLNKNQVVIIHQNNEIKLWVTNTGKCIKTIQKITEFIRINSIMKLSSDIIICCLTQGIHIIDVFKGNCLKFFKFDYLMLQYRRFEITTVCLLNYYQVALCDSTTRKITM